MTNAVRATLVCPKCGESVEIIFTKKELKQILNEMKLSPQAATIQSEKRILRSLNKKEAMS